MKHVLLLLLSFFCVLPIVADDSSQQTMEMSAGKGHSRNKGHQYKEWANGSTSKSVSPNSCVMVYGMNNIPYIAPLILQNETIDHSQYIIATTVTAGNNVDGNRTNGNVTIANGTTYEIEASGDVVLQGGFNVERGARFHIIPSDY